MNCAAMSTGFLAPYLVGMVLESGDDEAFQWQLVFWFSAAFASTGALVFLAFGSADIQAFDCIAEAKAVKRKQKA